MGLPLAWFSHSFQQQAVAEHPHVKQCLKNQQLCNQQQALSQVVSTSVETGFLYSTLSHLMLRGCKSQAVGRAALPLR